MHGSTKVTVNGISEINVPPIVLVALTFKLYTPASVLLDEETYICLVA
jgi:hypothetical protein